MNQNMTSESQLSIFNTINQVEGFDPVPFAVEYTDLTTQQKRKRLPVMIQMAWFRLKYPMGKIAQSVVAENDCFVATAKVYVDYKDPADCYLSEATVSRKYDPTKPTVSPREWAQTAAIGTALRNAGFGLQFSAAGDDFDSQVPDELGAGPGAGTANIAPELAPQYQEATPADVVAPVQEPVAVSLTPEQRFQQACAIVCPIRKHSDKTLGEVLNIDPGAIHWLATKFKGDETVRTAAEFICSYALDQASA